MPRKINNSRKDKRWSNDYMRQLMSELRHSNGSSSNRLDTALINVTQNANKKN